MPSNSIRIEAENMALDGYRIESDGSFNFASGQAYTSLADGGENETGTATLQFSGDSGKYDITVGYFDENDGVSSFSLVQGDRTIRRWRAARRNRGEDPSDRSLVQRTFANISLTKGDRIQLVGTEDGGEAARIDYIEFTPQFVTPPDPSVPLAGSNGILEIMPLGDSITQGEDAQTPVDQQTGFRDDLANKLNSAGIQFDFVGSRDHGDGFDSQHEGRAGWTIDRLSNRVEGWVESYEPEIILLQIGTNDMGFTDISVEDAIDQLSVLIDRITEKRPAAQLIVSSITPTNSSRFNRWNVVSDFQDRVDDFNSRIPSLVSGKKTQGKLVSFVNAGGGINNNQDLSSDGYHPSDSGYQKIATSLFDAITDVIDNDPGYPDEPDNPSAPGNPGEPDNPNDPGNPADPADPADPSNPTGFTSQTGNRLKGSRNIDTITGTSNNEEFRGLRGNDILTGGGGQDIFAFGSIKHSRDTITDFGSDDAIRITAKNFGGGLSSGVALQTSEASTGVLVTGTNPLSLGQSATFLYNTQTQTLSFDQDGVGNQYSAIEIAQLTGVSSLSVNQIQIM